MRVYIVSLHVPIWSPLANSPPGQDVIMKKRTVHTKNDHYNDNTVTNE